jgi:membrane protease subunit (stomatin/prohibitin family)
MRPIRDTKFGGPLQAMKDPELEITVSPRIFGTFQWRIAEPEKFIVNYLGMGESPTNDRVESFIVTKFMNAVKKTVPTFVIRQKIEVQALGAYHDELGQTFLQKCDDLSDIGVQFLGLGDFSINFSDEELKRIQAAQDKYAEIKAKKRAKDELTGGNYMGYAAAEAMLGAGQGMAKGGGEGGGMMQGGLGFGMGMSMAQMYQQQMQPQPGAPPGAPPPTQPMGGAAAAGGLVACGACGKRVAPGKFCAECGAGLAPVPKACAACGTVAPPGGKFCANCGTAIV